MMLLWVEIDDQWVQQKIVKKRTSEQALHGSEGYRDRRADVHEETSIDVHEETSIDVHGNWRVKRRHSTEDNRRRMMQGMHAHSARSVVATERCVKS
jgi:hypothetical protein